LGIGRTEKPAGKAQSVFDGVRFSTAYCAFVRNAGSRRVNLLPAGVHLGIMMVWSIRDRLEIKCF
jgi:hypothetical protein